MTDLMDTRDAAEEARPQMDPRFVRRWVDARRQEGRRRLQILLVAGGVLAAAVLAGASLYSPLFHVRHLRVTVTGPATAAQVTALTGVSTRTPMIDVHVSAIAARLDADPVLGGARVVRRWPGTVEVSVAARTPLALAATAGGRWAEVDATGRVLATVATRPLGVPVLQGLAGVPAVGGWLAGSAGPGPSPADPPGALVDMTAASDGSDLPPGPAAVLAVLESLPSVLRAAVLTAQVGPGPGLTLVVSPPRMAAGTVAVYLGDGSQLQQKVAALLTMMDQADLSGVTGLDLSVPARPAIETAEPPFPPLPVASGSTPSPRPTPATPASGAATSGTPTSGTPTSGTPTSGTPTSGTPTSGTPDPPAASVPGGAA